MGVAALLLAWTAHHRLTIPVFHLAMAIVVLIAIRRVPLYHRVTGSRIDLGPACLLLILLAWGPWNAAAAALADGVLYGAWRVWRRQAARSVLLRTVFRVTALGLVSPVMQVSAEPFRGDAIPLALLASVVIAAAEALVLWFLPQATDDTNASGSPMLRLYAAEQGVVVLLLVGVGYVVAGLPPFPLQASLAIAPLWIALHSFRLMAERSSRDIQRIAQLNDLNHGVISVLATAIEAKDRYTNKHVLRVQVYALAISEKLGLSPVDHEAIRCGALLHDIGKLVVPENILMKPGKLTPDEYRQVQMHAEVGAEIIRPVPFPWPVLDVVRHHHERWDGLGYPEGRHGTDIPIGARVVGVADVLDALTVERPYRAALSRRQAADHIASLAGTHFDPDVVQALLAVLPRCSETIAAMSLDAEDRVDAEIHPDVLAEDVVDQIAHANSELLSLYDVSRSVSGNLDLEQTLNIVADKTQQLLPFRTCAIFLRTGAYPDEELRAEVVRGRYKEWLTGMTVRVGEGLSGRVFQSLSPIINGPAMLDVARKMPPDEEVCLNQALVVPLRAGGRTLGTISLYHSGLFQYSLEQARLLDLIAEHSANAIDSALRFRFSHAMAHSDALTGLPNARALTAWVADRLDHARQSREPFALLLMDLDNFKMVNDTQGHLRGDEVLCSAGKAMQACVRSEDVLVRYAGDEFVVGIRLAHPEAMDSLCERLCSAVDQLAQQEGLPIGLSVGAAIYPDDGIGARDLLEMADQRMYRRKALRKSRQ